MTWLLWLSLAALALSGATALIYELLAVFTQRWPTISAIVQGWADANAGHKALLSGIGIGALLGLVGLLVHFLGGF
jgi:hypothetical protein